MVATFLNSRDKIVAAPAHGEMFPSQHHHYQRIFFNNIKQDE